MEEEKLSRADTKRLFIQELERYLLRISQKGDRLRKSSTKFSVARYSCLEVKSSFTCLMNRFMFEYLPVVK